MCFAIIIMQVLHHMAEIEQPWVSFCYNNYVFSVVGCGVIKLCFALQNCPHGRPVMRHLLDLSRLS